MPEQLVVVGRPRGDLAIGLARPEQLANIGILVRATEKTLPHRIGIVIDVRVSVSARQRGHAALEFRRRRGAKAAALVHGQRQVGDRHGSETAPAFDGDVHALGRKADHQRKDATRRRLQFQRRIGDAALPCRTPRHGIVAQNHTLIGPTSGILRPGNARGRIKFHLASGGQHKMNRVQKRRLARAVVPEEESPPSGSSTVVVPRLWNSTSRTAVTR